VAPGSAPDGTLGAYTFSRSEDKNLNHTQSSAEINKDTVSFVTGTDTPRGHETILLVEDEPFLREVTCEILESAGYRVLKTRNAAEATSAFSEYKTIVRLLLTDVVLPGQNGRDLANDLRAACPKLRILFISGYPENVVTRNGIQEDGMFYLPKPFSLQSLTHKVAHVLGRKERASASV
jgi:two-component system, cell cycle sensor histidine kinase and response regulator CckA